jgi:hypothetical protein
MTAQVHGRPTVTASRRLRDSAIPALPRLAAAVEEEKRLPVDRTVRVGDEIDAVSPQHQPFYHRAFLYRDERW